MALTFDGSTQYVDTAWEPVLAVDQPFSICCWVYWVTLSAPATVYGMRAGNPILRVGTHDTAPAYVNADFRDDAGNFMRIQVNNVWTQGAWIHTAFVRDIANDKLQFYKNGVAINAGATDTSTGPTTFTGVPLHLGQNNYGTPTPGNVILDDFAIWSVTLTPAEVLTLAKSKRRLAPSVQPGSLLRWYPLQGVNGAAASGAGSVQDYSANLIHGTPTNSPVYALSTLSWPAKADVLHAGEDIGGFYAPYDYGYNARYAPYDYGYDG